MPSSLADIPSPLYPRGSNGIAIYETASKVLIPKTGLFLSSTGAPCSPSPCAGNQRKWKVLVKWAALNNKGFDFYLSISDESVSGGEVVFKTYSRLMSQLVSTTTGQLNLLSMACPSNYNLLGFELNTDGSQKAYWCGAIADPSPPYTKTVFHMALKILTYLVIEETLQFPVLFLLVCLEGTIPLLFSNVVMPVQ